MTTSHELLAVVDAEGHRSPIGTGPVPLGGLEVVAARSDEAGGVRLDWSVRNPGPGPAVVERVGVEIAAATGRVLEHGWQSWSVVRRAGRDDVRAARRRSPHWRTAMLVADPAGAGRRVCGDQFLLDEAGVTGFLSADQHFGTVAAGIGGAPDTAWALLDGITLEPGEERVLDPLWLASGDPGATYSRFASLWADRSGARADEPVPAGWCSWYRHQNAVSPDDVRRAVRQCRHRGLSLVQVDDGYQAAVGDWRSPSPRWPAGVAAVGSDILSSGLRAGIWTAPFLLGPGSPMLGERPDLLVRDGRGRPRGAIHHPGLWGGWAYALDTTHPAVLDHLEGLFAALTAEGFTYHKIDFLYAAALAGRRHDEHATRAQALRRGLQAVRRGAGDDAFLLGCGCPFGPAVGVVDAMRVSTDVTRRWRERSVVPGFSEAQSGLCNAVRASVLRAPLHRRLWANDPDCALLERGEDGLSTHHRRLQVEVVAGTGGFTMLSDRLESYGASEWAEVARLLSGATHQGPLDLVDPFAAPLEVASPAGVLRVDWRGEGTASFDGGAVSLPTVPSEAVGA